MNFAALPPEVNSALMYTGAGSAPMMAAATAWDAMAAELQSAAGSYQSVIAGLADESWRGPAAVAMAAAAAPYAAWMSSTAAQAEQAAGQAKAAAVAYETAFVMTVPPPVIAANRAQLMALVATNFLGQNTPAIAAAEALYGQMWAQDAAAMYGYAGSAAAATRLSSFTAPRQNTNPGGVGAQGASVLQAAGGHAQTAASQLSAVPQTLQGLSQPVQPAAALPDPGQLAGAAATTAPPYEGAGLPGLELDLLVAGLEVGTIAPFEGGGGGIEFAGLAIEAATLGPFTGGIGGVSGLGLIGDVTAGGGMGGLNLVSGLGSMAGLGGAGGTGAAWAGMGQAASMGSLSVPQAWVAAAPSAIPQVALVSAESAPGVAAAVAAGGSGPPFAEMGLAGMAGRAMAGGSAGRGLREPAGSTSRARPGPVPSVPEGSTPPEGPVKRIGIVAELRALVELRDSGILSAEKFTQRKQRLLDGDPEMDSSAT